MGLEQVKGSETRIMPTMVSDHVLTLPTYTNVDWKLGEKYSLEHFGQFGCTSVGRTTSNGDFIIGRSMDVNYSNKPAYILRSNVPGCYKTIGISYNPASHLTDYEEALKNGIPQDEYNTLLFFTEDIYNEKGFFVEVNMRFSQMKKTGIVDCTGTNPNADLKLSICPLVRYLGEHAANVEEALKLAETVSVFGFYMKHVRWGGGLYMADKSGRHGLLELVDNKLVWTESADGQGNYYIHADYKDRARVGAGVGRLATLLKDREEVENVEDMKKVIRRVRATQLFKNPYTSQYDVRSDISGDYGADLMDTILAMCKTKEDQDIIKAQLDTDGTLYITYDNALDDRYKDEVLKMIDEGVKPYQTMTEQELRDDGSQWLAAYQSVVNLTKGTYYVEFFEDENNYVNLSPFDVE